jgi:hypothetical protein
MWMRCHRTREIFKAIVRWCESATGEAYVEFLEPGKCRAHFFRLHHLARLTRRGCLQLADALNSLNLRSSISCSYSDCVH